MNKLMYQIIEDTLYDEDSHAYFQTYGLCYGDTLRISDISLNIALMVTFIQNLNSFEASPSQIHDLVDDFLA